VRRLPSVPWLGLWSVLLVVFLYAPLAVATVYAFNSGTRLAWPPEGFSLRWFQKVFGDELFRNAFWTSMNAAILTAVIAATLGTISSIVFARRHSRWSQAMEALGRLPVMLPPLFIGIGFVALMKSLAFSPSMVTIVAGHTIVVIPFVILIIAARLRTYELELEQAARDLGATPREVLARITLPIIAPAIFGAFLVAFAFSFDEILITNFTSGTQSTVPIYILGRLRRLVDPGANAVAVILLMIPWIAFGIGQVVLRRVTGSSLSDALVRQGS
jgi:spermidine/putrescine transport system permease protein